MRSIEFVEIHSKAFSARIEAVDALRVAALGAESSHERLYNAVSQLCSAAQLYEAAPNAAVYNAFAELVQIVGLAVEWRESVLNAKPKASRFIDAAHERAKSWLEKYGVDEHLSALKEVVTKLGAAGQVSEIAKLATEAATIPLPIGV